MPDREYQTKAVEFALKKKTAFMMVDMGLGKTLIALRVIEKLKVPALVIAPLQPLYNTWPEEITKWTDLSYTILHGQNKNIRLALQKDIYLLNYDGLKWFFTQCVKGSFTPRKLLFVLDESSWLKDPSSQRFKLIEKFQSWMHPVKLLLSATPASKGLQGVWSQMKLLDGGRRLGKSYYKFKGNYFVESGPPHFQIFPKPFAKSQIYSKIKDLCFRLEAVDHIKMPKLVKNAITVSLPSPLRKQYQQLEADFVHKFEDGSMSIARSQNVLVNKLRQFLQGAMYVDVGGYRTLHTLKVDALYDTVEALNGRTCIVAVQYHFEIEMIRKRFGYQVPVVNSSTSLNDKLKLFRQWNTGDIPVLLAHPKSMGHGLNLQSGGHHVIWYCLTWSLDDYTQLIGRLKRPSQASPSVVVNHIIVKNSMDEVVYRVLLRDDATQQELLNAVKRRD